eukprot:3113290-Ditylum_brightwellii.AAC.1
MNITPLWQHYHKQNKTICQNNSKICLIIGISTLVASKIINGIIFRGQEQGLNDQQTFNPTIGKYALGHEGTTSPIQLTMRGQDIHNVLSHQLLDGLVLDLLTEHLEKNGAVPLNLPGADRPQPFQSSKLLGFNIV